MTSENVGMNMPVVPAYGGGYGSGNDLFGGNSAWFLLILLALFGWGGNGFGFNGNGGVVGQDVQRGFDQATLTNGISGIQTGLCNGFAGVNQAISNGFAQAEIAANSRQMADMNQNFSLQSAFQNCCCENRQATSDLKYTMATEAANTRANCDANNQKILDKLCQLEMDGMRQNYEGQLRAMQAQLTEAQSDVQALRFAASQGAQTAQILANNEAQTSALEQYLAPVPRPAYIVQNPNGCGNAWNGCGCGA